MFSAVITHDFVTWDDGPYVTDNSHVRTGLTWAGVTWAFTTATAPYWHPLTWLSHMTDVELFGLWPGGHHLTSLILHVANTLVLFRFLLRATGAGWRSAFVAVVFAVHPLHVESVAWVAERKDVLSTFFWLLTMSAYLRYTRRPTAGAYGVVLAVFSLGLMAKPMLVTLPFVLVLLDVWPIPRTPAVSWRRLIVEKIPLVVLAIGSSVITFVVQAQVGAVAPVPMSLRIANALTSYVSYVWQFVWPVGLAAFYPYPQSVPVWWPVALGMIVAAFAAAVRCRRSQPWVFVGVSWYLGTLLPVIGLVQVGGQSRADRFTYVPMVGLLLAIGWGVPHLLGRHRLRAWLPGVAAAAILGCAFVAHAQTAHWKNSRALWQRAVDVTAGNYYAHSALGAELADAGLRDQAEAHQREALRIRPSDPDAHNELGKLMAEASDPAGAAAHFSQAVTAAPAFAEAHHNLGTALFTLGRTSEAIASLEAALRLQSDLPRTHHILGRALASAGRFDDAIVHLRAAVDSNPSQEDARALLASTLAARGRPEEAVREFEVALERTPRSAELHFRAAMLHRQLGNQDSALRHGRAALAADPSHAGAAALLAELLRSGKAGG